MKTSLISLTLKLVIQKNFYPGTRLVRLTKTHTKKNSNSQSFTERVYTVIKRNAKKIYKGKSTVNNKSFQNLKPYSYKIELNLKELSAVNSCNRLTKIN